MTSYTLDGRPKKICRQLDTKSSGQRGMGRNGGGLCPAVDTESWMMMMMRNHSLIIFRLKHCVHFSNLQVNYSSRSNTHQNKQRKRNKAFVQISLKLKPILYCVLSPLQKIKYHLLQMRHIVRIILNLSYVRKLRLEKIGMKIYLGSRFRSLGFPLFLVSVHYA